MVTDVRRNETRSRYELLADGELVGYADYRVDGDRVVFPHTVVDPARRGEGLAGVLVGAALDDVRSSGRRVVPSCWYVDRFIERHPEYDDLRVA